MQRSIYSILLVASLAYGAPTDNNGSSQDTPSTGSGLAYAESCQAKLFAWRSSKTSFGSEYGHSSTSIFSSEMSIVSVEPETPTVTSLITLCDGHPRVVGQWTTSNGSSTTLNYQWTNTNPVFVPASYPTPKPCSISPDDCQLLYSSWTSRWNSITSATPDFSEGLDSPPCETSQRPQPSYSTNAKGEQCDNCLIAGRQIRLLFWPVTTVAGSGDLCEKSAETFTGTATGSPRSVVTDGMTITSPTIAVSIGGLSRVDDCGTTVDHTIIPVLPEEVSSVEGARALFTHRPFNFADLNYKCLDDPDEEYITTGTRTDCYREVPASAYFTGYANAAGANWIDPNAFTNRTIWPNYQPQVLPPTTITEAIRSLWGPDCYIHPDGIWDPPIALQQENSFPLPKYAPGAPTQYYTPHTDAPQPGGPTTPHAPEPTQPQEPTAEAQLEPSTPQPTQPRPTGSDDHDGDGGSGQDTDDSSHVHGSGHEVVYTTVITYASGTNEASDAQTENGGYDDRVSTFIQTSTAQDGADGGGGAATATAQQSEHTSDAPSRTTGFQDPGDASPTDGAESDNGSEGSAGSSDDGSISSAIQSGIGGGARSSDSASQANIAISITKTIGVRLSLLALAASVFL